MRKCPGCQSLYDESVKICPHDGLPLVEDDGNSATIERNSSSPKPKGLEKEVELKPGMEVGEYRIEHLIAEGGMGRIFAGIHPVISKRVAIKVLAKRFAQDSRAISRFELEAKSVNQIGHHNIVDIFSIGELQDGRRYLIMELLDGIPLHHLIKKVGKFKPGEILPVYEQLCDALEAAHSTSFIHRDLKPDNIVVLKRPPRPFIKILDFGIAKLRDASSAQENTEVGTVLGTPEYMAPEQCRGGDIDSRIDIYALGVMLYELLTGKKPFSDPNPLRVLSKQMRETPKSPRELSNDISPELEAVILKAMAKKADERYATVGELYQALTQAIPTILPWSAPIQLDRAEITKPKQDHVKTIPPEEPLPKILPPKPRQVSVPAPVQISTETSQQKALKEAEDDELDTLVAVVDVPVIQSKPIAEKNVSTPPIREISSATNTLVNEVEPAMLVDRPVTEMSDSSYMVQNVKGERVYSTQRQIESAAALNASNQHAQQRQTPRQAPAPSKELNTIERSASTTEQTPQDSFEFIPFLEAGAVENTASLPRKKEFSAQKARRKGAKNKKGTQSSRWLFKTIIMLLFIIAGGLAAAFHLGYLSF